MPSLRHWYVACQSSQLRRRPVPRTIFEQPLVLFRDQSGQAAALVDRCAHRNTPLSQGRVSGDHLVCPYHGWEFDRAGRCRVVPGLCEEVPPLRGVRSHAVAEQQGLVWVCPSSEASFADAPKPIPLLETPGYTSLTHEFSLEAGLLDALENFLDGTHTHFVHAGLVRRRQGRKRVRAIIRGGTDWVEAEYLDEGRQSGFISRLFGFGITRSFGRFLMPSTVQLEYRTEERIKLLFNIFFTPRTRTSLMVHAVVVGYPWPFPAWMVKLPLKLMLKKVLEQDRRILAMQAANLRRFGKEAYSSTELDLLRPYIARLLKGERPAQEGFPEKQVSLML